MIQNPISKQLEGSHRWIGADASSLESSAEQANNSPWEYIHDPECLCGRWTTGEMRAWWADPMGKLISEDECGCKHFELGNYLCRNHIIEIASKLRGAITTNRTSDSEV